MNTIKVITNNATPGKPYTFEIRSARGRVQFASVIQFFTKGDARRNAQKVAASLGLVLA